MAKIVKNSKDLEKYKKVKKKNPKKIPQNLMNPKIQKNPKMQFFLTKIHKKKTKKPKIVKIGQKS